MSSEERELHRISCKIALFNYAHTKVLVAYYRPGMYGLIGGHLGSGETPDEAILREIREELGFEYTGVLKQVGFSLVNTTSDEKICLEYHGELDEATKFVVDTGEMRDALWVSLGDIRDDTVPINDYKSFVLKGE